MTICLHLVVASERLLKSSIEATEVQELGLVWKRASVGEDGDKGEEEDEDGLLNTMILLYCRRRKRERKVKVKSKSEKSQRKERKRKQLIFV